LRERGITPRIARRGIESGEKLGRYRWVVERTLSWMNRFRRLKVRYERRDDIHQAFSSISDAPSSAGATFSGYVRRTQAPLNAPEILCPVNAAKSANNRITGSSRRSVRYNHL
jgi:hypothetical protein